MHRRLWHTRRSLLTITEQSLPVVVAQANRAYYSPPYGGGAGGRAYILVILNHLKHVGNLLDAFLQGLLHHLLDEHIEFGLDGEFHLA